MNNEITGFEDALIYLRKIVDLGIKFDERNFKEFDEKCCEKIAAVDGSFFKILDGGAFYIFIIRTGYVIIDNGKIIEKRAESSLEIVEDESEIEKIMMERERKFVFKDAITLFDGIAEDCRDNVAGISKKSSIKKDGVPLFHALKKFGEKNMKNKRWYYKVEDNIYAVKFHPSSKFIFRVDTCNESLLPYIAHYCNDITNIGYPYPLAMAHRMVEIKKEEADYIKQNMIKHAVKYMSMDDWEDLFYDYHFYLEE